MFKYYREFAVFFMAFVVMCFSLALGPVPFFICLALYVFVAVPRFWRVATEYNTEVAYRRKKQNIETQIIQGRVDGQIIRETVSDMRRRGQL